MTGICLPIDASGGAPSFPAAQHRVAMGALMLPVAGRPLGARSGVRAGNSPTITATASTWTITPFTGVADPNTALTAGAYLVAFLANETGAMTAANATNPRIDRLDVQVPDEPAGASPRAAVIVYTAGVAAATPAAPAAPARSFPLAQITVPAAGQGNPSVSKTTMRFTTAAGGILPAADSSQYPSTPYLGQYIDDATLGLLRWDGAAWRPQMPADTGWIALTLQAPWSGALSVRMIGNQVHGRLVALAVSGGWPNASTPIANLPSASWAPPVVARLALGAAASGTAGVPTFQCPANSTQLVGWAAGTVNAGTYYNGLLWLTD